jgi:hypothetical protein
MRREKGERVSPTEREEAAEGADQRATLIRGSSSERLTQTAEVGEGAPATHVAFHDSATIPPGLVRKILTKDIGLSGEEPMDPL